LLAYVVTQTFVTALEKLNLLEPDSQVTQFWNRPVNQALILNVEYQSMPEKGAVLATV
jgi:hypothetical protein